MFARFWISAPLSISWFVYSIHICGVSAGRISLTFQVLQFHSCWKINPDAAQLRAMRIQMNLSTFTYSTDTVIVHHISIWLKPRKRNNRGFLKSHPITLYSIRKTKLLWFPIIACTPGIISKPNLKEYLSPSKMITGTVKNPKSIHSNHSYSIL